MYLPRWLWIHLFCQSLLEGSNLTIFLYMSNCQIWGYKIDRQMGTMLYQSRQKRNKTCKRLCQKKGFRMIVIKTHGCLYYRVHNEYRNLSVSTPAYYWGNVFLENNALQWVIFVFLREQNEHLLFHSHYLSI